MYGVSSIYIHLLCAGCQGGRVCWAAQGCAYHTLGCSQITGSHSLHSLGAPPPPPHTHTPLCLPHISRDRSRSRSMTPDGGYRPRKRQEAPKAAGEGGGEGIIKGGAWFSWVPPTQGVG
jgi:hypothetical protein